MTQGKRSIALMSAVCLAVSGLMSDVQFLCAGAQPKLNTLLDFHRQISQLKDLETSEQTGFASLSFDSKSGQLFRNGVLVDASVDGFTVVNGELMVEAEALTGQLPTKSKKKYLTLDEAKTVAGCEVIRKDTEITVVSPFQNARLILKTAGKIDCLNAKKVVDGFEDLCVLQFSSAADAYAAYQIYQETEGVEYVEPDRTYCVAEARQTEQQDIEKIHEQIMSKIKENSDAEEDDLWGVSAISADTYCEWLTENYAQLPELTVAVIDTGIYYEHTWFEGRISENGKSFVANDDGIPDDLHGHGSHCAGIVCSATADNVKILPIQALDQYGFGETLEIYCAMRYAMEQGADVISMSLGGYGESALLNQAAVLIHEAGIPLCVAAGNEMADVLTSNPANAPNVIAVSSVDEDRNLSYFSNYGEGIDFSAPGENIFSVGLSNPDALVANGGTSMATPFVAAVCADILSVSPELSSDEVYGHIKSNVIDLGTPGFDTEYGWGMVSLADFDFVTERCAIPVVSEAGGTFYEPIAVKLECRTENAKIYYTVDGTVPNAENGILYDGNPIEISVSTKLQAIAYDDKSYSDLLKEYYIFDDKDIENSCVIEDGVLVEYRGILKVLSLDYWDDRNITAIGKDAFRNNRVIDEVFLPASVTVIEDGAFRNTSLSQLSAPGVTKVGAFAFENCELLEYISTGNLTEIGESCFSGCSSLFKFENKDMFSELTVIPNRAFLNFNGDDELNFKNVEKIGNYAFAKTFFVESTMFDGTKITSIGNSAFAESGLEGPMDLPSLQFIGEYAFANSDVTSLRLPEGITEIPEGLLAGCRLLEEISAPAITKVHAYGLSLSQSDRHFSFKYDFDCSAITEIGEYAFATFSFDSSETFSALEAFDETAFDWAWGDSLSLPTVTRIERGMSVEYQGFDTLYLENVEYIGEYAFFSAPIVVIGDACQEIDRNAFAICELLAGPKGSPVENYANLVQTEFAATPSILPQGTYQKVYQKNSAVLNAVILGFDLECRWYRQEGETLELIEGAALPTLDVDTSEVGKYTYVLRIFEDDAVVNEMKFTVEVEAISYEKELCAGGYELIFFDAETSDHFYSFTPTKDGDYYFTLSKASDIIVTIGGGSLEPAVRYEYEEYMTEQVLSLKAGETYYVRVERGPEQSDGCCMLYCLTKSLLKFDRLDSAEIVLDSGTIMLEDASGLPAKPKVDIMYYEEGLVEGEDYILVYEKNETFGCARVFAFGISGYVGYLEADFIILTELKPDQPIDISHTDAFGHICFTFTPETSGYYTIQTDYTESVINSALNGTLDRSDIYDLKPNFEILQQETEIYITVESGESEFQLPSSYLYLEEGLEYEIWCNMYSLDIEERIYSLSVSKDTASLHSCELEMPFTISYMDGASKLCFDDLILTDSRNHKRLVRDEDYTISYYVSQAEAYVNVVVTGIGDYCGTIIAYPALNLCTSGGNLLIEAIELDEPFRMTEKNAVYSLTVTEPVHVQFTEENGASGDVEADFVYYEADSRWSVIAATLKPGGACVLTPNVYQVEMRQTNAEERTLLFETAAEMKSIEDAVITIPDIEYTGSLVAPDITVSLDGEILVEGKDYICNMPAAELIACGEYNVRVVGIGAYFGEKYAEFSIYMPLPDEISMLETGETTVSIDSPGEIKCFKWIPEASDYLISNRQLENIEILVNAENGESIVSFNGFSDRAEVFSVFPGETYYVYVRYEAFRITGEIVFELVSEYRMLYDCMIEGPKFVKLTEDNMIPEFELTYYGDVLIEGTDYYVSGFGNVNQIGRAEIVINGMGKYYSTITYSYIIYDDRPLDDPMALELDVVTDFEAFIIGHTEFYSFTAPEDGCYMLFETDASITPTVICYSASGEVMTSVSIMEDGVELAKGETIYFVMIAPVLEEYLADMMWYSFTVGLTDADAGNTFTQHGITYRVDENYNAVITGVDESYSGVYIASYIYDSDPEELYDVIAIDPEILYQFGNKTIFVDLDDSETIKAILDENGLAYAYANGSTDITGDVTLDNELDINDALTLQRFLNEGKGMTFADNIIYGDYNEDGTVNMMDVVAILARIGNPS